MLCNTGKGGRRNLPNSIRKELANKLTYAGLCRFFIGDKIPESKDDAYFPLPNYSVDRAEQDVGMLEKKIKTSKFTDTTNNDSPAQTRSGTAIASNPFYEVQDFKMELEAKEKALLKLRDELGKREKKCKELEDRNKHLLMERQLSLLRWEEELQDKLREADKLLTKVGGMSRLTLTNKIWHNTNMTASTCLFGFSTWKETVLYIHALFGLYPPTESFKLGDRINEFEWCLAAKIRMNCGLSYRMIGYILGLKEGSSYVGRRVIAMGTQMGRSRLRSINT